ncbi:uncharacterized protein N7529_000279 [Penicillium soppii]|uniref:uncharacterized protein n=1 Tax=Penicillium soppii TaxID=69789 RepID=UPI0025493E4E|nr:uncharacterized protein N7529_000279 [Penicillium soppii]KAJ5881607.1 hypothetical protein N7529_000279 [Penicillium soppii]
MKNFLGIFSILAIASPSFCQRVCTADDVRVSLLTVEYLAGQMQSLVDIDHSDIDPSGRIYRNFMVQTNHLIQDLQCNIIASPDEQLAICSAYEGFAAKELAYLHVSEEPEFYQRNNNGPNGVKVHGYILQAETALENYTSQIRNAVPSCTDRIDAAYQPLGVQLAHLLQSYPGTA